MVLKMYKHIYTKYTFLACLCFVIQSTQTSHHATSRNLKTKPDIQLLIRNEAWIFFLIFIFCCSMFIIIENSSYIFDSSENLSCLHMHFLVFIIHTCSDCNSTGSWRQHTANLLDRIDVRHLKSVTVRPAFKRTKSRSEEQRDIIMIMNGFAQPTRTYRAGWPVGLTLKSNSVARVFIFSYGCCWACCPPMHGQAHREHSCYSRWHYAPDYKPFEFTHLHQSSSALKDILPRIILTFYNITSSFI